MKIRVVLPTHLKRLANLNGEVALEITGTASIAAVLDTLEEHYPMLRGTIRDQISKERRPFVRFFACGEDLSHNSPDDLLPARVLSAEEPLRIVGAMAGG